MTRASFPQSQGAAVDLLLARHGQTAWNQLRRCQGFSDIELDEVGCSQARALARSLARERLRAVYASTLQRSWRTAEIIAAPHDLEVVRLEALRELNHGAFEGLRPDEIRASHGDFLERWFQNPAGMRLPRGESLEEVQERAWEALLGVIRQYSEGKVVVVGHQMLNLAVLCKALGIPIASYRRLAQEPSAVNILRFQGDFISVVRLNDTCHLRNHGAPEGGEQRPREGGAPATSR
ncbi:MAG: histidine phosphatase family protein [Candidatus Tectomicrobia bacterium]|nr:histidine phosphatase family protein [Candidatus Tectomicrobia bacterium]